MRSNEASQYHNNPINLRELVFGFNDGLVSTFAFVAGLYGAGVQNNLILLVGMIGAFASALSMGFGAWLSTKSENEMQRAMLIHRKENLGEKSEEELLSYLKSIGLKGRTLSSAKEYVMKDKEVYADMLLRNIDQVQNSKTHSPLRDSLFMFVSFIIGAIFPLLSYGLGIVNPFVYSIMFSFGAAFAIGAIKTRFTRINWVRSGLETLFICLILVIAAYLSGIIIESIIALS